MRFNFRGVAILTVLFTALTAAGPAFAYKAARVGVDQAEVKESPSADSPTKTTFPKGTRLNTSDQSSNGYYRVRSSTDSGWVQESDLQFIPTGGPAPQAKKPTKPRKVERMEDRDQEAESHEANLHTWSVKVFGGLDFWSPSDVNNLVGSTALNGGNGFGGEVDYGISKDFFAAFRLEKLTKSSTGTSSNGDQITLSLASTPVMGGLGWRAARGENFSLDVAAYLGFGFSTGITETDNSQAAPNVSSMVATAPTFLLVADINWHITDPFWLFFEPGYRVLKTGQNNLTTQGNGSGLFTSNGQFVPFAVDLSGPVVNFGARINF